MKNEKMGHADLERFKNKRNIKNSFQITHSNNNASMKKDKKR